MATDRFWLNEINEFFWEIIHPDGRVHEFIEKTCDDSNRSEVIARVRTLNGQLEKLLR